MLIDSHCHVDFPDLSEDITGVVMRARSAGVSHFLCVSVNLADFPRMVEITAPFEDISLSVGVHPNETLSHDEEPDANTLLNLATHERVVAIGETGLDYFRSEGALDWQRDRFAVHIAVGKALQKPVIVHCRHAAADTVELIKTEGARECGGVMHCFAEDWATAREVIDQGFYISFSGILTFKNAAELREVAKKVPLDRILIETDSPYLAPHPFRGKTNEPALVRYTAECLAELKGLTLEEVAQVTSDNFSALFPLANVSKGLHI